MVRSVNNVIHLVLHVQVLVVNAILAILLIIYMTLNAKIHARWAIILHQSLIVVSYAMLHVLAVMED